MLPLKHFALLGMFVVAPSTVMAHEFKAGSLTIVNPWARATPGGAKVAGAYVTISNAGPGPDVLTGGASSIAAGVEVHESSVIDGVARMRRLEGLEIKPGETVRLAPGSGAHLMFQKLERPLKVGSQFPATLIFEKAGSVQVVFEVEGIGAGTARHH